MVGFMFLMMMFEPTLQPTDKRRSVDVSGSKDEDVRHARLPGKSTAGERAQPRIAVLRRAVLREVLGGEFVDQLRNRRDVNCIPAEFVRVRDDGASTVAGRFDARRTAVSGRQVFGDD